MRKHRAANDSCDHGIFSPSRQRCEWLTIPL
jgi:hypothetical protein